MAVLESKLRATLVDNVSAAARNIAGALGGIGRAARAAGGGRFGDGIAASAHASTRAISGLQTRILAATAAAYGLGRAVQSVVNPAGKFETTLLDIAQKADLSDSAMGKLGDQIRKIAKDMGRGANAAGGGMDTLLGMGLDKDKAIGILPTIVKGATAYNAEITDLSKAGMASIDNLQVKVGDFSRALDGMAKAGKEGAFELKDMARYFPSLASLGQTLKLKGVEGVGEIASALQVIRKGAGTSEEAATRLSDVFGKITSEETKKKFKKLGVDIEGNLRTAQARAEKLGKPFSAVEFIVENLNKALKGDIGRIGEIFQDKEAKLGAIALMTHFKEFQRIFKESMNAGGTVEGDYVRRMKTFEAVMARFKGAAEDLGISIGNKLMPTLSTFFNMLSDSLNGLDQRVSVFDHIGKAISGFANGLGLGQMGSFAEMLGKLRDAVFGSAASFEADVDRLSQTFAKFQTMGAQLKGFGVAVAETAQAVASFLGVDLGGVASTLGTLAGYGAQFALAAGALALMAKSLRAVGSALLFVSGIKAAAGVVGMLGGLAGKLGSAAPAAAAAAPKAAGAAAPAAAAASKGARALGVAAKALPVVSTVTLALDAKSAIDAIGAKAGEIRTATREQGLHSAPKSADDGREKLEAYRSEIAEVEGALDRMRAKSRDPESFAIANQAQIARLAELKAASSNLEADMAKGDGGAQKAARTGFKVDNNLPDRPQGNAASNSLFSGVGLSDQAPDPRLTKTAAPTSLFGAPATTPAPLVDSSSIEAVGEKAAEAKGKLDGLGTTVTPQVDTSSVQELSSLLDGILAKFAQIGGAAASAKAAAAGVAAAAGGRGRSDAAQATANLSRSRETNNQDRALS